MPAPAPFRGPRLDTDQAPHVVIPWLVRLRWVSVLALAAAAWAAHDYWHVRLPALALIALAALAATNAALAFQLRSPAPRRAVVGAVLLVDVGLLTGILYLVGGPINPFSIVYLVGITVAAVALGYRWAIALGIVSNVAYGFTFFHHRPLEFVDPSTSGAVLTLHLYGMWVAFGAATGLIAYFVGRVSEALAERERELTATRAAASKSERLAALFALGAGAAHELATPLSTIRYRGGRARTGDGAARHRRIIIFRRASPLGLPYWLARGGPYAPRRSPGSLAAARSIRIGLHHDHPRRGRALYPRAGSAQRPCLANVVG